MEFKTIFFRLSSGLLLLLAGATAQAQSGYYRIKDSTDFSFEKLQELIESQQLKSIEQVLSVTKDYYPEYFDNYIMMYHSRSLQGSSFEAPRVMLFDRSAQFILTFNGDPKHRGYDRLEIMQFRADQHRFEFREITFSENKPPEFSEPNPAKCMVCHQDTNRKNLDPRPNWEPYNIWPGAYGSNNGRLENVPQFTRLENRFQNADPLMFENMGAEKEKLATFFQNSNQHSRYKYLDQKKFDPHLTVDITQMLSNLNARRVVRIVQEEWAEYYKFIEPAFAGLMLCGQFMVKPEVYEWMKNNWPHPEYVNGKIYLERPPIQSVAEIRRSLIGNGFAEVRELKPEELDQLAQAMYERQFELQKEYMSVNISQGLHHLFEPFGISTKDWSMDFMTNGLLAFRERFGTPSNTQDTFRAAFRMVSKTQYKKYTCAELGLKAEKGIEDLMRSELFKRLQEEKLERELKTNTSILPRCVKCHQSDDAYIPQIAFDKPEILKQQLVQKAMYSDRKLIDEVRYRLGNYAKDTERMPLGPPVTQKQRDDVISYLESLLAEEK